MILSLVLAKKIMDGKSSQSNSLFLKIKLFIFMKFKFFTKMYSFCYVVGLFLQFVAIGLLRDYSSTLFSSEATL